MGPGDGRRIVRRPAGMRQPISGSGRPRSQGSVSGGAQAGVDLAGDVALETADDLGLRQALGGAPLDVGAGRGVGAHRGDHDRPPGVIGLAVAAGVEAVAGALTPRKRGSGRRRTDAPRPPRTAAVRGGLRRRSGAGRRCRGRRRTGRAGRERGR